MLRRLYLLLLVIVITATTLHAMNGSFVGRWKLNPEKKHDARPDESHFRGNQPATHFDFGGGPEFIVANGTDPAGS